MNCRLLNYTNRKLGSAKIERIEKVMHGLLWKMEERVHTAVCNEEGGRQTYERVFEIRQTKERKEESREKNTNCGLFIISGMQ